MKSGFVKFTAFILIFSPLLVHAKEKEFVGRLVSHAGLAPNTIELSVSLNKNDPRTKHQGDVTPSPGHAGEFEFRFDDFDPSDLTSQSVCWLKLLRDGVPVFEGNGLTNEIKPCREKEIRVLQIVSAPTVTIDIWKQSENAFGSFEGVIDNLSTPDQMVMPTLSFYLQGGAYTWISYDHWKSEPTSDGALRVTFQGQGQMLLLGAVPKSPIFGFRAKPRIWAKPISVSVEELQEAAGGSIQRTVRFPQDFERAVYTNFEGVIMF